MSLSRRDFLKTIGATTLASHGPYIHAEGTVTLRVIGTHATLQEPLRQRAERELGIHLHFEPGGNARVLQKASTQPEAFDVYEQWSNSINILWSAGAIQALDLHRIHLWDKVNPLTKEGRLTPNASLGKGDRPSQLLYMQSDGHLGHTPTSYISFLPYVHNVDSFGYNTEVIPRGQPYITESWGWLLDDRWRGQVAIVNDPTIGIFDCALAAEACGLMKFNDIGAMTKAEINTLFNILIKKKQQGHFSGFWDAIPVSVEYFASKRASLSSLFSPGAIALNTQGIPVIYAAPKEGYRAWHGVLCLSAKTTGRVRDAAYEYLNWWLSGWAGAYVARQGYYISVPERARPFLSAAEWDYWYEGKPATEPLRANDGTVIIQAGETRNGGSYWERFSHVAVWNTVMDTYEYSLPRWYEFLIA